LAAVLTALLATVLTALLATAAALLAALASRCLILLTRFLLTTLLLTAMLLAALLFATHHVSPSRKDFRPETMFFYDFLFLEQVPHENNKLPSWNNVPRFFSWLQKDKIKIPRANRYSSYSTNRQSANGSFDNPFIKAKKPRLARGFEH
jgi:hypothetical protein